MTLLFLLAGLLCPDMPAGPSADTPMLLALDAPASVQIKTLDVVFDGAKATLDYRLANPTKASVSLKFHVEVSAERCEGECCEPLPVSAPDLRVDGTPLTPSGHTEARGMRRFAYALTVPASRTLRLIHRDLNAFTYDHAVLAGVGLSVLRVGTPWRWGPIEEFTWTIHRATRPWGVEWPIKQLRLSDYNERPVAKQGGTTTLRFGGKALVPNETAPDAELRIKFDIEPWGSGDDCVAILLHEERALKTAFAESPMVDAKMPDATMDRLIGGLSDAQLEICRNTPYALHGYRFKRADLQQSFYGDAEEGRLGFAPNTHFKPSLLSTRANRLIRRIKAEEARRRTRRK